MGHELVYETYMCGTHSKDIPDAIRDNEDCKRKIEDQIFALICMDPSKVRDTGKYRKDDGEDDYAWMNNAQYLATVWNELKGEWEDTYRKLIHCGDAASAIHNETRDALVCPDCHRELKWEKIPPSKTCKYYHDELVCPVCRKIFANVEDGESPNDEKVAPLIVTLNTWSES